MSPRVNDGDLSLFFRNVDGLETGDVVLFNKDGKNYISRIVAVEDDIITLNEDNHLFVNNEKLSDTPAYDLERGDEIKVAYPHRVPPGKYFVVNDNLESNSDSRFFGTIDKKDIYGKVISILRTRDI